MTNRQALENLSVIDGEIEEIDRLITKERGEVERLTRRLTEVKALRRQEQTRIWIAITKLDSALHRKILIAYYINKRSVISISQEIGYSESMTYNYLNEAVELLKL